MPPKPAEYNGYLTLVKVDEPVIPTLPEFIEERMRAFWYKYFVFILPIGFMVFLNLCLSFMILLQDAWWTLDIWGRR